MKYYIIGILIGMVAAPFFMTSIYRRRARLSARLRKERFEAWVNQYQAKRKEIMKMMEED